MRILSVGIICISLIGGCGPTEFSKDLKVQLAKQKSQKPLNIARTNEIWTKRKGYAVSGLRYEVGISPDRTYALISPIGQDSFSLGELEGVAETVTGCSAKGDSFLYLLGANSESRIPISALKKGSNRLRVELSC